MVRNIDLTNCDKEPVKFIGSVQSFGGLVVIDPVSQLISHASSNIKEFTEHEAYELLGKTYSDITLKSNVKVKELKQPDGTLFEFEKESKDSSSTQAEFLSELEYLQNAPDLRQLMNRVAKIVSKHTGMDRTMIYKFHEDLHGEVIAEEVKKGFEPFLGLHYPASDIPLPAREIFLSNWIRVIPDRDAKTFPLLSRNSEQVDLTKSIVRAVSPIHLEYMKNIDFAASVTISLKVNGKLWGLITCGNQKPKALSHPDREFCELVGRFTSVLIFEIERKMEDLTRTYQKSIYNELMKNLSESEILGVELTRRSPNLMDIIPCSGVAIATPYEDEWMTLGKVPSHSQLNEIVNWLNRNHKKKKIFATDHLKSVISDVEVSSGIMALRIPISERNFVFWFRDEYIRSVTWGGNPNGKEVTEDGKISPRKSFSSWSETVKSRSQPWLPLEIEMAKKLRTDIMSLNLKKQFILEQTARQEAERAIESREELISIVSHDLKNPLTSIMINAKVLGHQMPADLEKLKTYATKIHRSAEVMNSLIDDILNITKIETGTLLLSSELLDINSVLKDVNEILKPIASSKGVELKIDFPKEIKLHYDAGRILQVLSNLVGNAIKFTQEGGKISVKLTEPNRDELSISVSDTGPGISKENLPYVFDRFWQAKQTNRFGTGLGLAIAKGIINAHGGKIWAESEPGQGSTFIFTLPRL